MLAERVIAVDLGAGTGRVVAVDFDGARLSLHEARRFVNAPVRLASGLHWDVPRMFTEIDAGLASLATDRRPRSVGVDSWGVDYGLLGRDGALLGLPYSYRDPRTQVVMEEALRLVPREEIFARTGVQFLPINTLYQLRASRLTGSPKLDDAATLLTIADLFHHHLSGARVCEATIASTTQCYEPARRRWSTEILTALDLPVEIFPDVVEPGTTLGPIRDEVAGASELRGVPVVAPGSHDTASAVAATPLGPTAAYISSGTWSLVGVELATPNTSAAALEANFTNERGVGGTYRFLRNVMGLWLFEECRRTWENEGTIRAASDYDDVVPSAGAAAPFAAMFDPDDADLLSPGDMPRRIVAACTALGFGLADPAPGRITRVIFEVLALRYRWILERIARITGTAPTALHVVGGGARNALLCQFSADACGIPVVAGPVEATSLGNAIVQLIAAGLIGSVAEGRELVSLSFPMTTYMPRDTAQWDDAYGRFDAALARHR
jgi:rhamnulokinase